MSETSLTVFVDDLIAQLDPERAYGERSFEEIVAAVRNGEVLIEPGQRLPVLRDAVTHRAVRGSGQPPQTGVSIQQQALRQFRELAVDDMPEAYRQLRKGMDAGDPRYDKIYWELLVGKMGEARGGDAMATAFKALIDAMQKPEERYIEANG